MCLCCVHCIYILLKSCVYSKNREAKVSKYRSSFLQVMNTWELLRLRYNKKGDKYIYTYTCKGLLCLKVTSNVHELSLNYPSHLYRAK